jgi:hypothetical protein
MHYKSENPEDVKGILKGSAVTEILTNGTVIGSNLSTLTWAVAAPDLIVCLNLLFCLLLCNHVSELLKEAIDDDQYTVNILNKGSLSRIFDTHTWKCAMAGTRLHCGH